MNGISGAVIEDGSGLEALVPEWWKLWRRIPDALPFQTPAWLLPWWRHFSPGALFTLTVRQGGRLVGLAPGYIEDGAFGRRILPLGISLSDHLDVLADPDCEAEALAGLAAAALGRGDAWDAWELEELRPNSAALRIPIPPGWADTTQPQSPCPILALDEDRPPPACFPRGKRRHLNLARNRAARRGELRIDRAEEAGALAALQHLFRLHRLRWESRGGAGVLASEEVQAFQRESVPQLQRAGLLRLYTLSIAGEVVAAHYQMVHAGRSYEYLTGFDPGYEYESPGLLLLAHAIGQAAAEGCREADFLRGGEAYKHEWGAVDRWNLKRSIRATDAG